MGTDVDLQRQSVSTSQVTTGRLGGACRGAGMRMLGSRTILSVFEDVKGKGDLDTGRAGHRGEVGGSQVSRVKASGFICSRCCL